MEIAKQLVSRLYRSHFFHNVLVMMTGTVLAQAITLAFVPVLARIYAPADFGEFGVFYSIVNIMACIASLRYNMALMLPKEESDAANILGLCMIVIVGISASVGVLLLFLGKPLCELLKTPTLVSWLWLLPFSIFFMGVWQALTFWSARRKQFRRASISQVSRAITGPGSQVAAGLYGANVFGLIIGRIIGDICGTAVFATQIFRRDWPLIRGSLSLRRIKLMAWEYKEFPTFSTPQSFINNTSQNVPSLLLAYYFGVEVVGFYSIGVRIIQLPFNLIKNSLSSVLFQKFSEVYNNGGNTYSLFLKTTFGLFAIGTPPSLLMLALAPKLAIIGLGEEWQTAGEYARWMILWLFIAFCNLPAQLLGQIYRQQKFLFRFEVVLLISRVLAIVIGGLLFSAMHTIIIYSTVGIIYNTALITWIWSYLHRHSHEGSFVKG